MAKKKQPTNLMLAEPKKKKAISRNIKLERKLLLELVGGNGCIYGKC